MSESNSGGSGWAASGIKILPGLTSRPQQHICDKDGGEEHVKSSSGATFVFIKDCKNASLFVEGKVGKVLLDNVRNTTVDIMNPVVGGTVEVVRCTELTIKLGKDAEVPVLQIDNSQVVKVHVERKSQLQSIYYIRCRDIFVLLEHEGSSENQSEVQALQFHLDDSSDDAEVQRVGHWDSVSNSTTLISERVVRNGIYPSTAQMKRSADE